MSLAAFGMLGIHAGAADWYTAAEDTAAGTELNYTVYSSWDTADVEPITYCPNDDASAYDIDGVQQGASKSNFAVRHQNRFRVDILILCHN